MAAAPSPCHDRRVDVPDLRSVRWIALRVRPPARALLARGLRGVAYATVGASLLAEGHAVLPALIGGVLGALGGALGDPGLVAPPIGVTLVPWGLLVERDADVQAIRWSGVHALEVGYHKAYDGSVYARVAIESIVGRFVGFAPDTLDLGALGHRLDLVVEASARPLATALGREADTPPSDTEASRPVDDGALFAERVLTAAERAASTLGPELGLDATYRDGRGRGGATDAVVRKALVARAAAISARAEDPWALLAAIAGELRLQAFAGELHRLAAAPHPAVAATARAALRRLSTREVTETDDETLSWFVDAADLDALRAWSLS